MLVFLCGRVTSVTPTVSAKQSVTEVDLYVDTDTIQAKIMDVDLLLKECNDILTFFSHSIFPSVNFSFESLKR